MSDQAQGCPNCGDTERIEEHSLVLARYRVTIGPDGSLDYGDGGGEVEWDLQRPYSDEAQAAGGATLYCQACQHEWTHQEPKA
jgi:hypothetical protein